jgi:cell division protein FtsZ
MESQTMPINLSVADTTITHLKPRISVIGVGGGGGNAVNNMIAKNLEGVDFVVANTDAQALAHSAASRKIQLGLEITQGLGAGARPEIGKLAAEEAAAEIEKELEGANMAFITAGMGGGTGSGAAPVVAKIAKEKGILTVGVVTKPFAFEGKKRMETAEEAVARFTEEVDSIIIIPNQNLFRIADKNTTLADAFVMADNVLYSGVRSITDLMMMPGLINLDFADIKSIMEDKGKAIMGTGEAEGENRARVAAEQALSNPLLDDCSMHGAKGVLINITGGDDITLLEIDEAANIIKEEVDDNANIIFGSSFDSSLNGKIRVSIVVTGIEEKTVTPSRPNCLDTASLLSASYAPVTEPETDDSTVEPTDDFESEEQSAFEPAEQVEMPTFEDEAVEQRPNVEIYAPEADKDETHAEDNFLGSNAFEDSDMLEKSSVLPETPQASALFNAIINKTPTTDSNRFESEKSLEEFLPDDKDIFSSHTSLNEVEEDPVLVAEHDTSLFAPKPEEKEEVIENKETKPNFIDKILGISIARKNRKEQQTTEVEAPRFTTPAEQNPISDEDLSNLEIPSFLRRK